MGYRIAPSILAADFSRLGEEVRTVEAAGAGAIHIDVMDGHFVPNLSMGPAVVKAVRRAVEIPLDVHLMITDPLRYLEPFARAGATSITFHIESGVDPRECIRWLRANRIGVGLALNPETPAGRVVELAPLVDMMLVMTVHPGFGGQEFMDETLGKIAAVRAAAKRPGGDMDVEVDGGIGPDTIERAAQAGANVFVAGSTIFGTPDPAGALKGLRAILDRI